MAGYANYTNGNPTIRNTIFWGNTAPGGGAQIWDSDSTPSVSDSVIQGGYAGGTNILTTDPLLGVLGNYGGFTQTIPITGVFIRHSTLATIHLSGHRPARHDPSARRTLRHRRL